MTTLAGYRPCIPPRKGPRRDRHRPPPDAVPCLDQAAVLVAGTTADDAERPTPCADWDVAALVGHLCAVARRVAVLGAGGDAMSVPSHRPDLGPADWAAEFARGAADARMTWADEAAQDRLVRAPFGAVAGRVAASSYVQELTTHSWDLAVATGRVTTLDPELASAALEIARRFLPAERRGGPMPFGPVLDVPAGAGAYQELAGWMGRDPHLAWARS